MTTPTSLQKLQSTIQRGHCADFEKDFFVWLQDTPQHARQEALDRLLMRTCGQVSAVPLFSGTPKIATFLLNQGANPNARDVNGQTPAMRCFDAIAFGFEGSGRQTTPTRRLLKALGKRGADFTLADNNGQTLLSIAEGEAFWNHRNGLHRFVKRLVPATPASPSPTVGLPRRAKP